MIAAVQHSLGVAGLAIAAASTLYLVIARLALRMKLGPATRRPGAVPPTTILKPLCGAEPGLYECLRSFCVLPGRCLQIVFGVRDPDDPALAVVRRLQREFPRLDLQVSVNPAQHGSNRKVSSLINMLPLARHEYLVIADADVAVKSDYLQEIVTPLLDDRVGSVTCLYRGSPGRGLWSLLGSLFVNEWFMPSVRVAALFGSRAFGFGATIALRRETLRRIGEFGRLTDQLPDDYRLVELTRSLGLRNVLCTHEVSTRINELSLRSLLLHQLRWLRTIRVVQPLGYALSVVTLGCPLAALGVCLAGASSVSLALLAGTMITRLTIASSPRRSRSLFAQPWLVALADLLLFCLWCWSFANNQVCWRGARFRVARDGSMYPLSPQSFLVKARVPTAPTHFSEPMVREALRRHAR